MEQPLAERQRVQRQHHAVNQGMPAVGGAVLDRLQVALGRALIAQRPKPLELGLANLLAGPGKRRKSSFLPQPRVEMKKFPCLARVRQFVRLANGRKLITKKKLLAKLNHEDPERSRIFDRDRKSVV